VLDPVFGHLILLGTALLLASAAAHKLRSLAHFSEIFAAYRLLPDVPSRRVAWLIPCFELIVAGALLWAPSRRMGAACAAAVLAAYASAMGLNLLRGRRDLDCGCGAPQHRRAISAWMVWRNLVLAAAVAIAALPWSDRRCNSTDLLTIGGGLIVGITLYALLERLLGDVAPRAALLRSPS
jgi:hypothetical protein